MTFQMSPDRQESGWLAANGRRIVTPMPFGIMGIVNVTPDSFYDGGRYDSVQAALERCRQLLSQGADILDIGAASSRPGAGDVSPAMEGQRLWPVLEAVRAQAPDALISIDTVHGATAARALELGAAVVNDISGCDADPELVDVLAQYRPAYILMHSQGTPATMQANPSYGDVLAEIKDFFERKLHFLTGAGVPETHIALDPGIGFGKTGLHNLAILRRIEEFREFGRPVLAGISMKSFFGYLLGQPVDKRGESTATASALLWSRGVFWHRVHNVGQVRDALLLAAGINGDMTCCQSYRI